MATHIQEVRGKTFAFIFPMASGHINPSLPVARSLAKRGHAVHYLAFEQMREAIEDTGSQLHLTEDYQTELFADRKLSFMEILAAMSQEFGLSMCTSSFIGLQHVFLERKMPGTIRFLRHLKPDGVVYCPLINREAPMAARVLGIPYASLNTIAGPGASSISLEAMLAQEHTDADTVSAWVETFEPDIAAVRRLNEQYGLDIVPGLPRPSGFSDAFRGASVNLVTTSEDLQDPISPELAQTYRAEGTSFVFVGPLLDKEGAQRAAGHKGHASSESAGKSKGPAEGQATSAAEVLERVRAARSAGRPVIMASMGTVITGDFPSMGWHARPAGPNGQPHGLTGRELCQSAWAGMFDAFGSADESSGPLLVVSLGPQQSPLGEMIAPPNAVCAPVVPQVDVLKAGVDLFLTHGGQNSFTEALAHATPVVVCPGFGDQIVNAGKAVALGVGLKVDRPFPPEGSEVEGAAQYRSEVSRALEAVWESTACKDSAAQCAERLRSAGGVPRATELVLQMTQGKGHPADSRTALGGA